MSSTNATGAAIGIRGVLRRLRRHCRAYGARLHTAYALHAPFGQCPILIYRMGKVGSSTVVRTLSAMGYGVRTLHIHTLRPDVLARADERERLAAAWGRDGHIAVSHCVLRKLGAGKFPCKVITLTREPVSRAISFSFETWRRQVVPGSSPGAMPSPEAMAGLVQQRLMRSGSGHQDPGLWFERETQAMLGIDVFSVPWNRAQGFVALRSDAVEAMVLRVEDLNQSLPRALAVLLSRRADGIRVRSANVGRDKHYADALRAVKDNLRLPASLLDAVCSTRYFKHFYAEEEAELRRRFQSPD